MNAGDIVVYDSMLSSNMPREDKSTIRKWFERMSGMAPSAPHRGREMSHVESGLQVLKQSGEGIGVGAVLAAVHVHGANGLDLGGKIPLDAGLAAFLSVSSMLAPDADLAPDARNVAANAFTVYSFRKMSELLIEKKLQSGGALPAHLSHATRAPAGDGDFGSEEEDPILRTAQRF